MESENLEYQLLARYLAEECSEQEKRKVEEWLVADLDNQRTFNELRRIWELSAEDKNILENYFDSEGEWGKLRSRMGKMRSNHEARKSRARSSIHSVGQKLIRIAAIFLVAGLVGVYSYQNWYQPETKTPQTVLREVSTANAQRANITLEDGTKVLLNAGSTVRFPHQFDNEIREVFLEGEAYFKVTRDPDKPFVIHSRGSEVRVLGTAFSVRSYEEDGQVRVVVKEGRVSFEMQGQNSSPKAVLSANEIGRYDISSHTMEASKVDDMELYLSWREGYLKFREEPMSKVAMALERRYGIKVQFEDPAIKKRQLTAFLKSRSLSNVLDVIAVSLDVKYTLSENSVSFFMP